RAARNNTRLGVTGLLVHARMHRKGEGLFAQWLEGDRRVVHDLYETIKTDSRHTYCEVLFDGPIADATGTDDRQFEAWALAQVDTSLGAFPTTVEDFLDRLAPVEHH
ncbi:MAG: BLUF domain-containing protein, partial [Bacteroidota bacterium]